MWSMPQAFFFRKKALLAETRLRCLVEHLNGVYTVFLIIQEIYASRILWRIAPPGMYGTRKFKAPVNR